MNEQEKLEYLAERQKSTPPLQTWAPKMTPEQQTEQKRYIKENNLPF